MPQVLTRRRGPRVPGRLQAWWASGGSRTRYEPELQPGLPWRGFQWPDGHGSLRDPRLGLGRGSESAAGPDLQTGPARAPGLGWGSDSAAGPDLQTGPARAGVRLPLPGSGRRVSSVRVGSVVHGAFRQRRERPEASEMRTREPWKSAGVTIKSVATAAYARTGSSSKPERQRLRVPVMILKIYSSNKGPSR